MFFIKLKLLLIHTHSSILAKPFQPFIAALNSAICMSIMVICLILNWSASDYELYFRAPKKIRNASQLRITSSGDESDDELLNMSSYSGVVEYFPEELVITLKAGTSIKEAREVLEKNSQAFSFYVNDSEKTIGSIYATSGSDLSDSVLGVQIINGKGDLLNFGGQVMKNVAGYDVSRLLVGSLGKLAVITQISFKVLPEQVVNRLDLKEVKSRTESPIKSEIEKKLKSVFDPYGVFI